MKKIILVSLLLLACVILLSKPIIKFETLEYDFGRIKEEGSPHKVDFKFSNTGDEPFTILKVSAGWGCTAPSWSTDEIKPGQSGIISVEFDSNNRPGSFRKSIKVFTSIDNTIIKLVTIGYVIATPGKLRKHIGPLDADNDQINLGEMFLGTKQTKVIKIHNTEEDPMHITLRGEYDGIEVEIEPSILAPAKYGNLLVHFNSENKKYGKNSETIQFDIKFADENLSGGLTLNTNIVEDFSKLTSEEKANPPKIKILQDKRTRIISNLKLNELTTEVIELENMGTRDLHIRNIQSYDKMFNIKPTSFIIEPGKKGTFNVSVIPKGGGEKLKSIITIISNDPIQSVLNFTIIGKLDLPKGSITKNRAIDIPIGKAANLVTSSIGKDDFVILDVRTDDEFDNGCIEGAVNIDFNSSDFYKMLKLMDKSKTYLVYCQSGIRSKKAIEQMSEIGFKMIYHMHEGIEGWKAKRLELVDPNS